MTHKPGTLPSPSPNRTALDAFGRAHGRHVVDLDGVEIGEVSEVYAEPRTGQTRFLHVAMSGVLGFGKAFTLIPVEAIVALDDERIVADVEPDRLLGSPSYLALGQPRWDIAAETPVLSADGKKVGEVVEVHPGFLFVERGVYLPHDLYIPNDAIAFYDGHEVTLKPTAAEIGRTGWDEAPPRLVRVEGR